jgi:hypothetical protein
MTDSLIWIICNNWWLNKNTRKKILFSCTCICKQKITSYSAFLYRKCLNYGKKLNNDDKQFHQHQ